MTDEQEPAVVIKETHEHQRTDKVVSGHFEVKQEKLFITNNSDMFRLVSENTAVKLASTQ